MSYFSAVSPLKKQLSFYLKEIRNVANKGFFYLFTVQGLIVVIGFANQFFVAGFLDPTDIGRIKIMQTYLNLAALICGLGFDTSLLKLASEDRTDDEKKKLYQTAFVVSLFAFILIYSILYFINLAGWISTDNVISRIFPLYLLFLFPLSLQSIQMAYYQSKKEIKKMARLQFITKITSIFLIVLLTYYFQLSGYVFSLIATGFLAIVVFEIGIKNISFRPSYLKLDIPLFKSMWKLAGFALIANIVGLVAATLDIYLINYLIVDREEVGFYMFALTILSVYQLFPLTIQQIAFPFFSQQSADYRKWFSSYSKYNKLNYLLVLIVFVSGLIALPFLINVVFSGKYDRSIHYFLYLSLAWTIKNFTVMKSTAIMGYGRFDLSFLISLVLLFLSYPVIYFAIKNYGLDGALLGMVIAAVISNICATFMFARFNKSLINGI